MEEEAKVQKGYHCAWQIHYHIVFPAKYRKVLLNKAIAREIKELAKGIQERYGLEIEQIGCDRDHVHLLCSAHPKYAPGQIVRLFKSITTREIFKLFLEVRKDLLGGEFWTDGYYIIATVGEKGSWGTVEKYVMEQGMKLLEVQLELW